MSRINREKLLQQLEAIQPGLAVREVVEQSSCYAFQEGMVQTFNDEIACSIETELDIDGAVAALPLLNLLRKLNEDELEIKLKKGSLTVKGKRRRANIRTEKEVTLPIDAVEQPKPKKWRKLNKEFCEAISIVQQCTAVSQERFAITCVHVTPEWIEACDNHQVCRYKLNTGMSDSLFRAKSLRFLGQLGMEEFNETPNWLHFRNPIGMVMSIKRFVQEASEFPDISKILKVKGAKTTLPKTLAEAVERAQIFSSENPEDRNEVMVQIEEGWLKVRGEGDSGNFTETHKLPYSGEPITFWVKPKLLADIARKYSECRITSKRLKVDGGSFLFVTCLKETRDEHEDDDDEGGGADGEGADGSEDYGSEGEE